MRETLLGVSTIIIFFAAGLYCLAAAKHMQRRAIKASDEMNSRLFRGYIRSKNYLVVARVAGVLCILGGPASVRIIAALIHRI